MSVKELETARTEIVQGLILYGEMPASLPAWIPNWSWEFDPLLHQIQPGKKKEKILTF